MCRHSSGLCKMSKVRPMCVVSVVLVAFVLSGTVVHGKTDGRSEQSIAHNVKRSVPGGQSAQWCGLPGRDGRDGRDGVPGPHGARGPKGDTGPPGHASTEELAEMSASIKAQLTAFLESRINAIESRLLGQIYRPTTSDQTVTEDHPSDRSQGGAVYIRWGRNSCPDHAEMLYDGIVAGSHFTHGGSGSNYLCLPLRPQWNRTVPGYQSASYLYGTEFEIGEANSGFARQNSGGKLQHNLDAQCSVCHTPGRQSHVMIPARLECPAGWTLEYIGFLMAAHHKHTKTEYVCVDQDPNVHPGTIKNQDGALFYITEVVCGSLPCPPYADGFEATCVVCTK